MYSSYSQLQPIKFYSNYNSYSPAEAIYSAVAMALYSTVGTVLYRMAPADLYSIVPAAEKVQCHIGQ